MDCEYPPTAVPPVTAFAGVPTEAQWPNADDASPFTNEQSPAAVASVPVACDPPPNARVPVPETVPPP
jgi:hypothetical protein